MVYKYAIGHLFTISVNTNKYIGKIIKIADIDEFGGDFHYTEKNYVVQFNDNASRDPFNFEQKRGRSISNKNVNDPKMIVFVSLSIFYRLWSKNLKCKDRLKL